MICRPDQICPSIRNRPFIPVATKLNPPGSSKPGWARLGNERTKSEEQKKEAQLDQKIWT